MVSKHYKTIKDFKISWNKLKNSENKEEKEKELSLQLTNMSNIEEFHKYLAQAEGYIVNVDPIKLKCKDLRSTLEYMERNLRKMRLGLSQEKEEKPVAPRRSQARVTMEDIYRQLCLEFG
jgi:hypothetical protein